MRLERVEIADYRSIFADERATPFVMDLAEGANTLVGTNNCGKSNVLKAIALALDPHSEYSPDVDNPGPRPFAHPIITLHFRAQDERTEDVALLGAAAAYEATLGSGPTYASEGRVILRVSYEPTDGVPRRRESLVVPSGANATQPEQRRALDVALAELREAVRFVLVSSGQSIRSVLEGNFREILHSVVREHLVDAFESAEHSRADYVSGIEESLLAPLRQRILEDIGGLFPEIDGVTLAPEVPTIEKTLSGVRVSLEDLVDTPLSEKGTGVRGGVLVAMINYLASNASRGMIFALEEPEAFLHPAAQEDLRDKLEEIATRSGISLLVTTHSPYIVTRAKTGRVFGLAKDNAGRTRVAQVVAGDQDHAPMVAGLFRESTFEELTHQASTFPDSAQAVLLVEGEGDKLSLELVARVVSRPDLLDGFHIVPTSGAIRIIPAAIIAKASTDKPVIVLVDNDASGRDAYKRLSGNTFQFKRHKEVLTYAAVFPDQFGAFPVEAEDLFEVELLESFIESHGMEVVDGSQRRPDAAFHYDFGQAAKELLSDYLAAHTRPKHVRRWLELILHLREIAGLDNIGTTVEELIHQAPAGSEIPGTDLGSVLIVTNKHDYARYQRQSALILETSMGVSADITHVGFYADAEIKPEFPAVLQHYSSIHFDRDVVDQLRATGSGRDSEVADIVSDSLRVNDDLAGRTRQLLLLSESADESSITLESSIKNTKESHNKPMAWAITPKIVSTRSIMARPTTTTELDELEEGRA